MNARERLEQIENLIITSQGVDEFPSVDQIFWLIERVRKLESALEFYGDVCNWEWTTHEGTHDGCGVTDLQQYKQIAIGYFQVGGLRARKALEESDEGTSE